MDCIRAASTRVFRGFGALAVFGLLVLSLPAVSLAAGGWAKQLSDSELSSIYAQGLRMRWHAGVNLYAAGKFRFNFDARGTVKQKEDDKDFGSNVSLLGGLFEYYSSKKSKNTDGVETTTIPIDSGDVHGEITSSVEVTGGESESYSQEVEVNQGGETLTVHTEGHNNLVSISASNVASTANVNLLLEKAGGLGRLSSSVTRTIRKSLCGMCY